MHTHRLYLPVLYVLIGSLCCGSSVNKKLSPQVQKRLAAERAKVRASIKKQFIQKKAHVTKKNSPKKPVPKKIATKKAPVPRKTPPIKRRRKQKAMPSQDKSPQQRLRKLRGIIDRLVQEADKKASVGVKVLLLKNRSTIYQKNAHQKFKPASNTKLITAAAAYHILGPDYRFTTNLYTDKKLTPHRVNHLYIKGSGDPTLTGDDLGRLVRHLKKIGIHEIQGDIFVDASIFNAQGTGPGWRKGDGAIYSKAPTGGLMVNHSCVRVRVKPAAIGYRPQVQIFPSTKYVRVINRARTRSKTDGKSLHVLRGKDNTIIVKGVISKRSRPKFYRIAVQHPHRYTGHVLAQELHKNNIHFKGMIKIGTVPRSARFLAQHTSLKLSSLIHHMMKASDNLYADSIFRAMGAHSYGAPGTWSKGKRAVEHFLKDTVGISTESMIIRDGSGLSHGNLVTPDQFCKLLSWVYTQSPHKESFIASLPIGGVDGTLRNRMKHRSTKGGTAIKAKTGCISGVTSLSGYITPKTGLPLIFVIMVNRKHKSAVMFKRKLEDQLCKLLAAHAFSTS